MVIGEDGSVGRSDYMKLYELRKKLLHELTQTTDPDLRESYMEILDKSYKRDWALGVVVEGLERDLERLKSQNLDESD